MAILNHSAFDASAALRSVNDGKKPFVSFRACVICIFIAFLLPEIGECQITGVRALYEEGRAVFNNGTLLQQKQFVDSLTALHIVDPDERNLAQALGAKYLRNKGQARVALELLDAIELDPDHVHDLVKTAITNERARALKSLKMLDEAMLEAQRYQNLATAFDMREEEVDAMILRSEIQRSKGDLNAAMALLIEAEREASVLGYSRGLCNIEINRGNLYFEQDRNDEAITSYRSVRKCAEENGWSGILANAILNEAAVLTYAYPDSFEVGLLLFKKGSEYARHLGDRDLEASLYSELGRTLAQRGNNKEALIELNRCLALRETLGDTLGKVDALYYLSSVYFDGGQLDSAYLRAEEMAALSERSGNLERTASARLRLAKILNAMGRYKDANAQYEIYLDRFQKLSDAKNSETMKVMEYRFETGKKDTHIKAQSMQIESDEQKKNWMMAVGALLLIVAALLFRNNRHFRLVNAQQRELHGREVNDLLKQQEIYALDAMLKGQDTERARIAKDLHDRLGNLLSAIKLQFSALELKLDAITSDQQKQYGNVTSLLDDAVREVRRVSHDLMKNNLSQFGLVRSLEELCQTFNAPGKMNVELHVHGMEERLTQGIEVGIYRIVQECISNTLKHAQATYLSIQLTRSPGMLNIMVEDNGKGFEPSSVKEGMGTRNIMQRTEELGGVVRFDSRNGKGTTVSIDIPLA